jgi:hypothetical protein
MVWVSGVKEWDLMSEGEREAMRYAWGHGNLLYKLDPDQQETYHQIKEFFAGRRTSFEKVWVNEWSRRLGKDFLTWVIFREHSRKVKNDILYYATAYETDINDILIPIIKEVDKDCPPEWRLKQGGKNAHWYDPITNTQIRLIGLDKNPNGIRGNRAGKIAITEASYVNKLDEAMTAYKPMVTESTETEQYFNSTPGETVTHLWHTEIVPRAIKAGGYSRRILDSCKRMLPKQIEAAYEDFGGRDSTKSRREYRCEHVSEETKMVIPEWLKVKDICVRDEYELPEYAHCYTIIDPGQVHLFAFLYLLYDWARDTVVAQRAYTLRDPTTSEVAESIRESEHELWDKYTYYDQNRANYRKNPYMRYSDVDLRLIKDLSVTYDLEFHPTKKDDLKSAVKGLRDRVHSTKYVVLPGAEELVWHLNGGIWDKSRKKFEDVGGLLGHFDVLACAVYGNRNLDVDRNPLPPRVPKHNEFTARIREKQHPLTIKRDRYGNIIDKVKDNQCPVIPDYL